MILTTKRKEDSRYKNQESRHKREARDETRTQEERLVNGVSLSQYTTCLVYTEIKLAALCTFRGKIKKPRITLISQII